MHKALYVGQACDLHGSQQLPQNIAMANHNNSFPWEEKYFHERTESAKWQEGQGNQTRFFGGQKCL
jgi:hypothetical protein